jgi:putative transposase
MSRSPYPSDLSDEQWALLQPLLPAAKLGGRPRRVELRDVLNAIFYVLRPGCPWRYLPHDFPARSTVYEYFSQWREDGLWEQINRTLRLQVRVQQRRKAHPSAAIIDSHSAKTTEMAGVHGYDGGKKVNGRKRHILVDTLGLLLTGVITAANVQDREAFGWVVVAAQLEGESVQHIWADQGYTGEQVEQAWRRCGVTLEVVQRHEKGFVVLPRRWVVERTLAWIQRNRRMSKDYEQLESSTEAWLYLSMIHLMLQRLAS